MSGRTVHTGRVLEAAMSSHGEQRATTSVRFARGCARRQAMELSTAMKDELQRCRNDKVRVRMDLCPEATVVTYILEQGLYDWLADSASSGHVFPC